MSTYIKIVLLVSTCTRLGEGTYVGCNLVQAGNQPLKMNIGPSFANLDNQHLTRCLDPLPLAVQPQGQAGERDRANETGR
jgi:hypothetical protein